MTEENTKNETSFLNEIAAEAAKIAASLSAISESNATEITDCACAAKKNGGTAAGLCLFENTIKEQGLYVLCLHCERCHRPQLTVVQNGPS